MIASKDRSGWFGASDTHYIMGNYNTKTFKMWWLTKTGLIQNDFSNKYTTAGTHYEHRILDSLCIPGMKKDKQIKIRRLRLRVNLDGNTNKTIHEVKTYKYENGFKASKQYWQQVQVQIYTTRKRAYIVAYGLIEEDYINYFNPIDKSRLQSIPIEYDKSFIKNEYLPRLKYLKKCLLKGVIPTNEDYNRQTKRHNGFWGKYIGVIPCKPGEQRSGEDVS